MNDTNAVIIAAIKFLLERESAKDIEFRYSKEIFDLLERLEEVSE